MFDEIIETKIAPDGTIKEKIVMKEVIIPANKPGEQQLLNALHAFIRDSQLSANDQIRVTFEVIKK